MGQKGPLDDPNLREVDRLLDQMRVSEAQHLLSQVGETPSLAPGVVYLSTRVLHLKGRLDARAAHERLSDLLRRTPDFPEARAFLERVSVRSSTAPTTVRAAPIPEPPPEPATRAEMPSGRPSLEGVRLPAIPKAPGVPDFHENPAAPSYVPRERSADEIARLRSKAILDRNAGRYSETPSREERLASRTPPRAIPSERARRDTVGHTPEHRSAPARARSSPRPPGSLPSVFELAAWIDAGRYAEVLAALDGNPIAAPEYAILRARALIMQGGLANGARVLGELLGRGPLDPELAASCARLYVDLGDPTRALLLAEQALRADPDRPMGRLTYVLAAVRTARRNSNAPLVERARLLLGQMEGRESPLPSLFQALKACVLAASGDSEAALAAAQRALGLDPRSVDAIAAIAEASARLGRKKDSREAYERLAELSPDEANALAARLSLLETRP